MDTAVKELLSLVAQAKPEMAIAFVVLGIPLSIVFVSPKLATVSITGTLLLLGVLGMSSLVFAAWVVLRIGP